MAETAHPDAEVHAEAEGSTQAPPKNTAPVYEAGFHLVPTLGDEGVPKAVEAIRKALGDVEVIKESFPSKITLAYSVERPVQGKREKYTHTYFGWIKFALTPEMGRDSIPQLHAALTAMPAVLRHLIIETVREDISAQRQRAVFVSDRLEGKMLEKPAAAKETHTEVSEEELNKSIEALTG